MSIKNISRIDTDDTHGWLLRMYRHGETYSKFFSDSRYASKTAALEAAQRYKARFEEKFPPPPSPAFRRKPQSNSSTGVAGVCRTFTRNRKNEKVPCYTVTWRPQLNVAKTKKFSISKYGEAEARRLAIAFRREKEREMQEL